MCERWIIIKTKRLSAGNETRGKKIIIKKNLLIIRIVPMVELQATK